MSLRQPYLPKEDNFSEIMKDPYERVYDQQEAYKKLKLLAAKYPMNSARIIPEMEVAKRLAEEKHFSVWDKGRLKKDL
jgi:hypothetical protein